MGEPKRPSRSVVLLTVFAAPFAIAFETLLRAILFPPEFEDFRVFLEPFLTPVAWVFGAAAAGASFVGLALQKRIAARKLARFERVEGVTDAMRQREVLGVFLLTASVPQIPAVLSTFAYMFGASPWPVGVGIALSTLGVIAQAVRIGDLAGRA